MKKKIIFIAALVTLTSCTTIGNFYDGIFGKNKNQNVPTGKRAPVLNQYSNPPASVPAQPGGIVAMPQQVPEAPDPFGAPQPPQMIPPLAPQSYAPAAPQYNPYGNTPLPADRRPPEFNNAGITPSPVLPVARAPLTTPPELPGLPELSPPPAAQAQLQAPPSVPSMPQLAPRPGQAAPAPGADGYPKLSHVPAPEAPPVPLKNDPRVQELQAKLAESKSDQAADLTLPPKGMSVPPPIDLDEPAPAPSAKIAKAEIPGSVDMPKLRKPPASQPPKYSPPPAYNPAPEPRGAASTDYRSLHPIASTDYRSLHPVASASQRGVPRSEQIDYAGQSEFDSRYDQQPVPNKVEVLHTTYYTKLRRLMSANAVSGGIARHSSID